jgi:hypothetical protein
VNLALAQPWLALTRRLLACITANRECSCPRIAHLIQWVSRWLKPPTESAQTQRIFAEPQPQEVICKVLIPIFTSLLARIVLGQWFNVMILAPAIAITLLPATAAACHRVAWAIGLNATGAMVGLQIGYLLAMIIHRLIVPVRVSHWRPDSSEGSLSTRRPRH